MRVESHPLFLFQQCHLFHILTHVVILPPRRGQNDIVRFPNGFRQRKLSLEFEANPDY